MWRRIASWRGRAAASAETAMPVPPDRDKLACTGQALRSSYGWNEDDEILDDRLVALMLELSVEPAQPVSSGKRARPSRPE
jgi:hypothetical protein